MTNVETAKPPCGEKGRAMFYEYVGQWFSAMPALKAAAPGTACSQCGATAPMLWVTAAGDVACIAQLTITRKRGGRSSANQPPAATPNSIGKNCMAEGTFVIAGPHKALIVTKLLPDRPIPACMEIVFSEPGAIRPIRNNLILRPPPTPFVAISFGKSARFDASVTVDPSKISINGPGGFSIEAPHTRWLMDLATRTGAKALLELAYMRSRLTTSVTSSSLRIRDEQAFAEMRRSGTLTMAEFRSLPSPNTPVMILLRQLAS